MSSLISWMKYSSSCHQHLTCYYNSGMCSISGDTSIKPRPCNPFPLCILHYIHNVEYWFPVTKWWCLVTWVSGSDAVSGHSWKWIAPGCGRHEIWLPFWLDKSITHLPCPRCEHTISHQIWYYLIHIRFDTRTAWSANFKVYSIQWSMLKVVRLMIIFGLVLGRIWCYTTAGPVLGRCHGFTSRPGWQ